MLKIDGAANEQIEAIANFVRCTTAKTVSFAYDHNGLRTQKKIVEGNTTTIYDYTLHGKLITHLTKTVNGTKSDEMHFFYDAQNHPAKVEFNSTVYTYLHNLQGDIVGIIDNAEVLVVEYKYDAWGKSLSTTGTLADTLGKRNLFRYRGYAYDEETELYYALNRFWNIRWQKFISPDDLDTVATMQMELTDKNPYAYCDNNPVTRTDKDGEFWNFIVGGVVGAVVGAATQIVSNVITGEKWSDGVATAAVTGAASGVLAASGVGIIGSVVGNAAISMAGNATNQIVENEGFQDFDVEDMLWDGIAGVISGFVGGSGMTKSANIRTLNRRLTKKIINGSRRTVKKAVKYYVSQTRKIYRDKLIKPMLYSGFGISTPYSIGKGVRQHFAKA